MVAKRPTRLIGPGAEGAAGWMMMPIAALRLATAVVTAPLQLRRTHQPATVPRS